MNKAINTLFVLIMCSISIFAQRNDSFGERTLRDELNSPLERCYRNTNDFQDFKRCYKDKELPICPRNWEMKLDLRDWGERFPCRLIERDIYNAREGARNAERDDLDADRSDLTEIGARDLSNEGPESFEPQ